MKYQMQTKERDVFFGRTIRPSGWLFMEAYNILKEEFGLQGEMAMRQWLRRWGI